MNVIATANTIAASTRFLFERPDPAPPGIDTPATRAIDVHVPWYVKRIDRLLSPGMNDDWRLRVELANGSQARELADHLANFDREHGLKTSFIDRVVVSRDDAEIFCYAATRDQAEAAEQAIRSVADEHELVPKFELKHWHPTAEEWEDPDKPLPETDAERAAERAELMDDEREESRTRATPNSRSA